MSPNYIYFTKKEKGGRFFDLKFKISIGLIVMDKNEKIYLNALNLIPEIDFQKKAKLLEHFGSFEKIWLAKNSDLRSLFNKNAENVRALLDGKAKIDPEKEFKKIESMGISFIIPSENGYPNSLSETPWAPFGLYIKGSVAGVHPRAAIVGTRRASNYGKDAAFAIAKALSENGVSVISGLALGIDSVAHEGALNGPTPTWAVLGSGLNNIYPKANQALAARILKHGGALISEYHPDLQAREWTFPERNRIVAGFSILTIVIEAPEKSGALITARLALEAGRDVAVLPADISRQTAIGSNKLLREGAHPILDPKDALYLLGISPAPAETAFDKLDKIDEAILQCLSEPKSGEEIIRETKLRPEAVSVKLTELELKNLIKQNLGSWSRKI